MAAHTGREYKTDQGAFVYWKRLMNVQETNQITNSVQRNATLAQGEHLTINAKRLSTRCYWLHPYSIQRTQLTTHLNTVKQNVW